MLKGVRGRRRTFKNKNNLKKLMINKKKKNQMNKYEKNKKDKLRKRKLLD